MHTGFVIEQVLTLRLWLYESKRISVVQQKRRMELKSYLLIVVFTRLVYAYLIGEKCVRYPDTLSNLGTDKDLRNTICWRE